MIIEVEKNDFKIIENLQNIQVPSIQVEIIEMIKEDYKFINKLLEYKRDATLALFNIYNAVIIYENDFNLKIEKNIKNWCEFFELMQNYTKIFISKGLNFYKNKETNNNYYGTINENFLAPIIKKIFEEIYIKYLRKFPYWNESPGKQNDYINIELKNKTDINNLRYYWNFQGIIFVQDTKYNKPINGNSFKVEFNGNPKFQIAVFDLNKLEYFRKIEKNLQQYIDFIDDKIIEQKLNCFNLDF